MTLFISNPSRGGASSATPGDPTGARASDPVMVSLRETVSAVDLTTIQIGIGFARSHALGANGPFDGQLQRTRRGSILSPTQYAVEPSISVVGNGLQVTKTSNLPTASTYFTSLDRGGAVDMSAMHTAVLSVVSSPPFVPGAPDPMGPLLGIEHGPRKTAAYCFFLTDGTTRQIRVCGPRAAGVRLPDAFFPFDWGAIIDRQYIMFWDEARQRFELWVDDTTGSGGIGNAQLIASIPLGQFQQFDGVTSVPIGGANDVTGLYGVEGPVGAAASIVSVATSTDVGFPFIDGARAGGWRSFLDSDVTVGFSGSVDPTRLGRGGPWFRQPGSDPLGQIIASPGGYCRILKLTPSSSFVVTRDEPGFHRTATDGLMVEFKCATSTSGGTGFSTGAAIQVSDGQTLFQLDFLFDGSVHNIGLLRAGGSPTLPSDHFTASTPIDYTQRTLRLVADPRRGLIDLLDAADLSVPLATWPFSRAQLPPAVGASIAVGLPVTTSPVTGALDVYSLKYSYIYQAWEARDITAPTGANPPYTSSSIGVAGGPLNASIMPGALPVPYSPGPGPGVFGTGSFTTDGFQIVATGGQTLLFSRPAPTDSNRGGILEAELRVDRWHPSSRVGAFLIIDDALSAYMLSFVETNAGRFVCIPLSAGAGSFQELAGDTGVAAKLSVRVDWTEFHTYRLERRPRDGVYLFIDNVQKLVLPDTARYSFPLSQLHAASVAFGQYTPEGATSVWKFVRDFFGSGYEISTTPIRSQDEIRDGLSNVRTTVVVTAGN